MDARMHQEWPALDEKTVLGVDILDTYEEAIEGLALQAYLVAAGDDTLAMRLLLEATLQEAFSESRKGQWGRLKARLVCLLSDWDAPFGEERDAGDPDNRAELAAHIEQDESDRD